MEERTLANDDTRYTAITATSHYVYAATQAGIYRSSDNGTNWTKLPVGLLLAQKLYATGNTVLVGSGTTAMFLSTDAGMHWAQIDGVFNSSIAGVATDDTTTLYVALNGTGLRRSTDHGTTWHELDVMSPDIYSIACDGNTLYASSMRNEIYVSQDTGATWSLTHLPDAVGAIEAADGYAYAATRQGVYRSTDRGNTWTPARDGMYASSIASISRQGNTLLALSTGELYRSTDDGLTWPECITYDIPDYIISIAMENEQKLYAGAYGGLYTSTDAGASWEVQASTDREPFIGIVLHPAACIAATSSGTIYRSTDGGQQWSTVTTRGLPSGMISAVGMYHDLLYADIYRNGIMVSTDDGTSWTPSDNGIPERSPVRLFLEMPEAMLAGTSGDGVYVHTDDGSSWLAYNEGLPTGVYIQDMHAHSDVAYVVATNRQGAAASIAGPLRIRHGI